MAKREDEYYRKNYYGGHPPACTCVKCNERRLASLNRKQKATRAWYYVLVVVCLASVGWLGYLLGTGNLGLFPGLFVIAIDIAVLVWAISIRNRIWDSFRSGIASLVVVLMTLIVTLAA